MATKNIVPRSSGEGTLGSSSKLWKEVHHVTASFGDISLLEDASNRLQLSGGPLVASSGLSGSLTQLSDGSSYLVEGNDISITTGSNGQITIASTSPGTTYTAGDGIALEGSEFNARSSIAVTVSGGKFVIDGTQQQTLSLAKGVVYYFDQSDASNASHPLRFSITSDGTHGGGSEFTTGITTGGTPGSAGSYTQVILEQDAPSILYYYCSNHSGMGGKSENAIDALLTGDRTFANNLTITGDLTVNGTTTTVDTDNLLVEDPIVLLGSGASAANANGGLALLSGSSVSGESLVIGRIANDTWGVGRMDVQGGAVTSLGAMTLVDFKAANITTSGNLLPDLPLSRDIGSSTQEWRDIYLSDDSTIYFGGDQDVSLVHDHNDGLIISMSNPSKFDAQLTIAGAYSGDGPSFNLRSESSSSDSTGNIIFEQALSNGNVTDIASIQAITSDKTANSQRSSITFNVESNGNKDDALIITGSHNTNKASVNIANHDGLEAGLQLAGTLVTSTATELNILDGATVTTGEINLLDGDTSVGGAITIENGDGFIVNDAGTSKLIPASSLVTYVESNISSAADDITEGDAAVSITTTSGNVTVRSATSSNLILSGSTLASLDADTAVNIRGGGNTAIAIDSSGNITQLGPDTSPNTNEYLVWNGTSPVWETWRGFKYNRLTSGTSSTAALGNHYSFDFTQIAASYTLNLPAVSASNAGHEVRIIIKTHNAGSSLTIQPDTGDTLLDVDSGGSINNLSIDVNDASSVGTSLLLVSDGTDQWEIL